LSKPLGLYNVGSRISSNDYRMPSIQGRYWILTIPHHLWTPFLPPGVSWVKGQLERGGSGYIHWQLMVSFPQKKTLRFLKQIFGEGIHAEPSRSAAADSYVWKEDTRIEGTQFELGQKLFKRNSATDWDEVRKRAKSGELDEIPGDVFVRYYGNLRRIQADYSRATPMERNCYVYWGDSGVGKSRRAWDEAGLEAYPKDPRNKWWCGYRGQSNVVIDEFRGDIGISHLLRWLDRYPVCVETKGSSVPLAATQFWITSNIDPRQWYPDLDEETKRALLRRMTVTHFQTFP